MPAALVVLLVAVAQQPITQPRDVPQARASAAISGRVTDRGSGRPLPRIVVTLLKPDSSTPLETLTDSDGRYQFAGIEPGAYALTAGLDRHRTTYLPQRYGSDEAGIFDVDPPRPNLDLKPGETRAGLDFALWRALGIEGRVLDPWESAMANVPVIVKRVTERLRPSARAYSDDRGRYRAYGLGPGRYRVCAEIQQHSDDAADTTRLGTTCHAGEIVLASEDVTGVDVRVQQFRTYSLSGNVVDASGSTVTGAFVGAYPLDDVGPSAADNRTLVGEFVLRGLAPRRYVVRAAYGETPTDDPRGNRTAQVGYAFADLSTGDIGGLLVTLSKPVDVAGTVMFEGARESIRRSGMVVQTSPVPQRLAYFDTRPPFSRVEDDLSFKLTRVYRLPLIVGMTGLPAGWVMKSVFYGGRDVTYVPTDFGAGAEAARLQITLTNVVAQPLVRVLDGQGTPAPSSHIVAVPADRTRWVSPLAIVSATRVQGDLMRLGPMLPGEYLVAALTRDDGLLLLSDDARMDALAAVATRVTLPAGDDRTLELRLVALPSR